MRSYVIIISLFLISTFSFAQPSKNLILESMLKWSETEFLTLSSRNLEEMYLNNEAKPYAYFGFKNLTLYVDLIAHPWDDSTTNTFTTYSS